MNKDLFNELPQKYQSMINAISNENVKRIYTCISFLYFFQSDNDEDLKHIFTLFLNKYKLISCSYYKQSELNQFISLIPIKNHKINCEVGNFIICVEDKCIIMEQIDFGLFESILKDVKSTIININSNTKETNQIIEEVNKFKGHFIKTVKENEFVKYTINSISCYLIRRFFYTENFFNDSSFFDFNKNGKSKEQKFCIKFNRLLNSMNIEQIVYEVNQLLYLDNNDNDKEVNQAQINEFKENEFIKLRCVYCGNKTSSFYLVIHIESLHIFMMKKFNFGELTQNQEREVNFCKKYSNRCFVPFYGFVKENNSIVGLIYKYMTNGALQSYIEKRGKLTSHIFSMLTMRRILNGIKYFHSNSFIYRDLKPLNVLLSNDNIPFISDFDMIKQLNENIEEIIMTNDVGSNLYISPEQYNGDNVSYPTDIYSFGLIIYFLFEHKEQKNVFLKGMTDSIPEITNKSPLIKLLYDSIVKYKQEERITIKQIENYILDNIKSFEDMKYLINTIKTIDDLYQISYYLYENISLLKSKNENEEFIEKYLYECYSLLLLHLFKLSPNNSVILNNIGILYYYGFGVKQDYFKAKYYFELSSNLQNSYGFYNLGYLYSYGKGVEQNYVKAKEFYEKSANLGNLFAFNSIGTLYKRGLGVDQDYKKAKHYYDIAYKLNVSDAMYNLAYLYYNGYGVEKDHGKAKQYYMQGIHLNNTFCMNAMGFAYENESKYEEARKCYEKAARLKNVNSLVNLALLYMNGEDCKHDYIKARKLFEKAASKNNKNAIYNLGIIYKKGYDVDKDYGLAKKYFEQASILSQNDASYQLGNLYFKGKGTKQDFIEAKKYYEISAKQGDSKSLFKLGFIYEHGHGTERNIEKALSFYESAALKSDYRALFRLGEMFMNGECCEIDKNKSIEYFEKCIETGGESYDKELDGFYKIEINYYYYPAINNLAVIHLTMFEKPNIELIRKYLNETILREYPLGQNNYCILCEFYLDMKRKAEEIYEKLMKEKFSLFEFNFGRLHEKNGNLSKAIELYIRASDHEHEPLRFYYRIIDDERLNLSKSFIVCLSDLKLVEYFLNNDHLIAKKYFIKVFSKLQTSTSEKPFPFKIKIDDNDIDLYSYIKREILDLKFINDNDVKNEKVINFSSKITKVNDKNKEKNIIKNIENKKEMTCGIFQDCSKEDPNKLFDVIIQSKLNLKIFLLKIQKIIELIENIVYSPPYPILYGRFPINLIETKMQNNLNLYSKMKNIDQSFYDGFM